MKIRNEAYFKGEPTVTMPKWVNLNNVIIEFKYDDRPDYFLKTFAYYKHDDNKIPVLRRFEYFEYLECIVYTKFKNHLKPEKGAKVLQVQLNFKLTETQGGETITVISKANKRMVDEICKNAVKFQRFNIHTEGPDAGIKCNMPLLRFKAQTASPPRSNDTLVQLILAVPIFAILLLSHLNYDPFFDALNELMSKTPATQEEALAVSPLQNYNNETKNSLLLKRKAAVEKSVFKDMHKGEYSPNETVFGGVQDKKPWLSLNNSVCIDPKLDPSHVTKGFSVLSRFIENPNVLLGVMQPYVLSIDEKSARCKQKELKFLPTKITYDLKNKLITAYYPMSYRIIIQTVNKNGTEIPYYFTLVGMNARDLGFEYGYVTEISEARMINRVNSIADEVYHFQDFIHVGGACGAPGGCNNISPYQPLTDFSIQGLPAQISFKLWKDKPIGNFMPADFNYKIVFFEE